VECGRARRHPVHVVRHIVAARRARVRQGGGHPCKAVSALCSHRVACPVTVARAGCGHFGVWTNVRTQLVRASAVAAPGGGVHVEWGAKTSGTYERDAVL
jgi:hypothetical protein